MSIVCRISPEGIPEITPAQLKELGSSVRIIDVRRSDEFNGELGHIEGAELCTLETDFEARLATLDPAETIVFVCRSGGRSGHATAMAQSKGFKKVYNMSGGMLRWI